MSSIPVITARLFCICVLIAQAPFVSRTVAEESAVSKLPPYAKLNQGSVSRDDIPEFEAVWGFYTMVVDMENHSYGSGHKLLQTTIGINEVEADQVFSFIRSAIEEAKRLNKSAVDAACLRRDSLTNRALIASEMRQVDHLSDSERSIQVQNLTQVLGPEEEARLRKWIDENIRSKLNMVTVDYDQYLNYENIDVGGFVKRMCERKRTVK